MKHRQWIYTIGLAGLLSGLVGCSSVSVEQEFATTLQQSPTAAGNRAAKWLFSPVEDGLPQSAYLSSADWVLRQRLVYINPDYLPSPDHLYAINNLDLNFFDDVQLRTEQLQRHNNGPNQVVWSGAVVQQPTSMVTLVATQGKVFATLMSGARQFQIEALNNGWHRITEVDLQKMPLQQAVASIPSMAVNEAAATHAEPTIDLMVVYSKQAQQQFPDIDQRIALAVEQANASLMLSGAEAKLRLVHQARIDYQAAADFDQDLLQLQQQQGVLQQVHQWRDHYGADLVSLWLPASAESCGASFQMPAVAADFASQAFSVLNTACAGNGIAFTQAIGRNLGLSHVAENAASMGRYDFSQSFIQGSFVTLMGTDFRCEKADCIQLPYLSSPQLRLGNAAYGSASANNVQTVNQTAPLVSAFRQARYPYDAKMAEVTNWVAAQQPSYRQGVGFEPTQGLFAAQPLTDAQQQQLLDIEQHLARQAIPPWVKRSRIIRLSAQHLPTSLSATGQAQPQLSLNLFDDVNLAATQQDFTFRGSQDASWQGVVQGIEMSSVNLVIHGDDVMGVIHTLNAIYEIEPLAGDFHRINEIDTALMPADHPPQRDDLLQPTDAAEADPRSTASSISASSAAAIAAEGMTGTEPMIDMMIVYEKQSREYYENLGYGAYYWPQRLQLQVDVLNTVLRYSQSVPRVRLAKVLEVDYASTSNAYTELANLKNSTDGVIDDVHSIRNQYGIDVVSMIMHQMDSYCGLGYRPTVLDSSSNFRLGFNVISRSCLTGLTFAHEFGHNVGMHHDQEVAGSCSNSSYSNKSSCEQNGATWTLATGILPNNFGYVDTANTFRTVMSYSTACSNAGVYCNRVFYYSSPNLQTSDGLVVGDTQTRNADVLNQTYSNVMSYKDEAPSQYQTVNVAGDFNDWSISAENGTLTYQGQLKWYGELALQRGANRLKLVADQNWDQAWGQTGMSISATQQGQTFNGLATLGGDDIVVNVAECGTYAITFYESGMYLVEFKQQQNTSLCQDDWQRTIVFIEGQTVSGQDMFIRGGIDHGYAINQLGKDCAGSGVTATLSNSKDCAISIRHNNLLNDTTYKWKVGEQYLDWYGIEPAQGTEYIAVSPYVLQLSTDAEGTALDWTTNAWPSDWGTLRTVENDGFGETPFNLWGHHYWMLDVDMNCSEAIPDAEGNRWFELKSYISNGPGWEPDVSQVGAPYQSGNHFAQCGKINMFSRGSADYQIMDFPTN